MQVKLFTIHINDIESHNDELNKFLRTHKIIEVDKHLVQNGVSYNWCFYISYIGEMQEKYSNKKKIDYMNVLDKETFAVFSKLRQIRKAIAVKHAVSAYIVFTDAELAEIAKLKELNLTNLKTIKGIGDKKAEKYGAELIEAFKKENTNEKSGETNTTNIPF